MLTRDELIEVGREAMGRNDGWRWWAPRHLARLLAVWEPIIRADELRHIEMAGVIDREVMLDDLRVKVLGLLEYHTFAADGTLDGADLVLRSDVLALLGGEPSAE